MRSFFILYSCKYNQIVGFKRSLVPFFIEKITPLAKEIVTGYCFCMNLNELDDDDLVNLYPRLLEELKNRGIIRTNNLVGELGEYIASMHYKNNSNFPQIQLNLKSDVTLKTFRVDTLSIVSQ